METQEERDTPGKLSEAVLRVLPGKFEELIEEIAGEDDEGGIDCVVADQSLGWALDIATRKGIRTAAFCPASAAQLLVALCIPELISDGIINEDGIPTGKQRFELAEGMPELSTEDLVWTRLGNETMQRHIFQLMLNNTNSTSSAQLILCNSALDLELGAFLASPRKLLPIGPLCKSPSSPSVDSSSSLQWLDRQEPGSVTYVAFGSLALLTKEQLEEIALGLEMTNRPFLWATTCQYSSFPKGWAERTAGQGKVVAWTDQREVLGHPSVGCFLSHCGWNSTIEGVSNGVPILCCPQFADQFLNKGYICDIWRVGVELRKDDGGAVVARHEIKEKVDKVYGDEGYRSRALEMKGMVRASVGEGETSHENLEHFVDWIKRV